MKQKIAAVFLTTHADTVGNASRISILDFFSQCFELIIYTNKVDFIKNSFDCVKVIGLDEKLARNKIFHIKLLRTVAKKINEEDVKAVFLTHDTAILAIWLKHPVFQYTRQMHDIIGLSSKRKPIQFIYDRINEFITLIGLRKSKANFVVSKPIYEYLTKKKVPNLLLTPHGVKLKLFENPHITDFHKDIIRYKEENYFLVGYTGWVSKNRGLQLMLESIEHAVKKDNRIALIVAGCEEKYQNFIQAFAAEKNITDNILVYGRLDHSLIPGILHLSDICLSFLEVNPSYEMSPPQKVIEYFAAGKPVLANRIKTHELLITDRHNGLILNENVDEISDTIIMLRDNKEMLAELSANARATAKQYDFDRIYGVMVDQIKSYMENNT